MESANTGNERKSPKEKSLLDMVCEASGYSPKERAACRMRVSAFADKILQAHPKFESYRPWEKAKIITTEVCDYIGGSASYKKDQHDTLEAFLQKKANCVGLSSVIGVIADRLGCEVKLVESPFHNYLQINGLNIDVTRYGKDFGRTRKSSKVFPKNAIMSSIYGWRGTKLKDKKRAVEMLQRSIDTNPYNTISHIQLNNRINDKETEKINGLLELERELGPSCEIYDNMALQHFRLGNIELSEWYLKRAMELSDDNTRVHKAMDTIRKEKNKKTFHLKIGENAYLKIGEKY